jgi:hypothetical protein
MAGEEDVEGYYRLNIESIGLLGGRSGRGSVSSMCIGRDSQQTDFDFSLSGLGAAASLARYRCRRELQSLSDIFGSKRTRALYVVGFVQQSSDQVGSWLSYSERSSRGGISLSTSLCPESFSKARNTQCLCRYGSGRSLAAELRLPVAG